MGKPGLTWSDEHQRMMTYQELGATVTKPPKGWQKLFGAPRQSRGLKVVSIVYDWKLGTDGMYTPEKGGF